MACSQRSENLIEPARGALIREMTRPYTCLGFAWGPSQIGVAVARAGGVRLEIVRKHEGRAATKNTAPGTCGSRGRTTGVLEVPGVRIDAA